MIKFFPFLISFLCLLSCNNDSAKKVSNIKNNGIRIHGSNTMAPLLKAISSEYQKFNSAAEIEVKSVGSNSGFESFHNNTSDIVMSSHKISTEELLYFRKNKIDLVEYVLAGDAIVFIVNSNNKVKKLTIEQIKEIFHGEITNWSDLGGEDKPISIYSRDSSSGTYTFITKDFLKNSSFARNVIFLKNNDELMEAINNDPNAISYMSFSNLDYSINALDISYDNGQSYISPRVQSVASLDYKLVRNLYLYYKPENYQKISEFINFTKQDSIQKLIQKKGYIPMNDKLIGTL
jgi:phosphate transport system substrate-binding protein